MTRSSEEVLAIIATIVKQYDEIEEDGGDAAYAELFHDVIFDLRELNK